jgi:hypothetical protein
VEGERVRVVAVRAHYCRGARSRFRRDSRVKAFLSQ